MNNESKFLNWHDLLDAYSRGDADALNFVKDIAMDIVDYPDFIKDSFGNLETPEQRDIRMENKDVYHGEIDKLISYLKDFDKGFQDATKIEILFKIYKRVTNQENPSGVEVVDEVKVPVIEPTSEKKLPTSSRDSNVDSSTHEVEEPEQDSLPKLSGNHEDNTEKDNSEEKLNMEQGKEPKTQNQFKEDIKMSSLENLNTMAQVAAGANVEGAKPKEILDSYGKAAVASIKGTQDSRIAFTKANIVTALITNAEPLAKRIPEGSKGVLTVAGKADAVIAKIKSRFNDATGFNPAKPEEVNYADKVHKDDLDKVVFVKELIDKMDAAPDAEYDIFVPNASYTVKGVELNSTEKHTQKELISIITRQSIGFLVSPKGIQNGEAVKGTDVATTIELAVAKVKPKAAKEGTVGAQQVQQEGVRYEQRLRVINKNALINEGKMLVVYPTNRNVGKDGMKPVQVNALITLGNGKEVPATFRYKTGDTKEVTRTKDGKPVKETVDVYKTFSVKLRTYAFVTQEAPAPEFAELEPQVLKDFGNAIAIKSAGSREKQVISTGDTDAIATYMGTSALVKALSYAAAGYSEIAGMSDVVDSIKAAKQNEDAEADAKAAESVNGEELA